MDSRFHITPCFSILVNVSLTLPGLDFLTKGGLGAQSDPPLLRYSITSHGITERGDYVGPLRIDRGPKCHSEFKKNNLGLYEASMIIHLR